MNTIHYIDLCCGIGGFRIAIENFSQKNNIMFKCVLSVDTKEDAIRTYNINFNEKNEKKDIFKLTEIPQFDLLCAGFPCQSFSTAGKKKGFDDDRGGIIFKIIDICKNYNPNYIILENVSNLLKINDGKPFEEICNKFKNIGLRVVFVYLIF